MLKPNQTNYDRNTLPFQCLKRRERKITQKIDEGSSHKYVSVFRKIQKNIRSKLDLVIKQSTLAIQLCIQKMKRDIRV